MLAASELSKVGFVAGLELRIALIILALADYPLKTPEAKVLAAGNILLRRGSI